jgi:ubiquinone/menaquinone biosynthesis C-methylase UbiE
MFICPKCGENLPDFVPKACKCGYIIPERNHIFYFTDDQGIKLEGENQYIRYDEIGINFSPASLLNENQYGIYKGHGDYGAYGACGEKIPQLFGNHITVLDLGAGLGTASIPIAYNGIKTIAADISQVMLSFAVRNANGNFGNLICAKMNAYDLPIADNSIDVVVENAMLHLVDHPEVVIQQIVRVLKPNGCLIKFDSPNFPLTDEQKRLNQKCNAILSDITEYYNKELEQAGYKPKWFNNYSMEILNNYFDQPTHVMVDFEEIFTEKLKFMVHRLQNKAHSDLQHVPNCVHERIWTKTEKYAIETYGKNFRTIPSYSRYGACLDIYKLK